MDYSNIRKRKTQFERVTGLKIEEFDYLLSTFSGKWRNYYRIYNIEGKRRTAPCLKPDKNTKTLPTVEEKLFFILVYLRNYSLQEMLAASFDFSQSQASKWVKVLQPLLFDSLKQLGFVAATKGDELKKVLQQMKVKKCFQDATEQRIDRPGDPENQKDFYTRKKKHTP